LASLDDGLPPNARPAALRRPPAEAPLRAEAPPPALAPTATLATSPAAAPSTAAALETAEPPATEHMSARQPVATQPARTPSRRLTQPATAVPAPAAKPVLRQLHFKPPLPRELAAKLPAAVSAALAALPPPGRGDAAADVRQSLLATALPGDALPVLAARPEGGAWGRLPTRPELEAVCCALRLLRVRRSCRHRPAAARRLPVCVRYFTADR
jgi:hypothetical protein